MTSSKYDYILKYFGAKGLKKASMDASDRLYFRLFLNDKSCLILQDNGNNKKLFDVQIKSYNFLKKHGIPIPEIITVFEDENIIIFEDLGELSLEKYMQNNNLDEKYIKMLNEILHKFGNLPIDEYNSPFEPMNLKKYMWGFDFFYDYYVNKYKKSYFSDNTLKKLKNNFKKLSSEITNFNKALIHRDFHSRNLFIKDGRIYVIDYQDLRLGNLFYDMTSLIFDLYSDFYSIKNHFIEKENELIIFKMAFQRLIKILGNFVYLLIEKNKPFYIKNYENVIIKYLNKIKIHFYEDFREIYKFLNENKTEKTH